MQTSPMTIFSENVRKALEAKKLNITELAEQIGMHRQELSKILNGRVDPTTTTLNRIAEGLGSSLYELFRPLDADSKPGKRQPQAA